MSSTSVIVNNDTGTIVMMLCIHCLQIVTTLWYNVIHCGHKEKHIVHGPQWITGVAYFGQCNDNVISTLYTL